MESLKKNLHEEAIGNNKKFTWGRLIRRYIRNPKVRYIVWWRIASYLYDKDSALLKKTAKKINLRLVRSFGTEISLGACIGTGITFAHHHGIVINECCSIGKNFHVRQNTTIGVKSGSYHSIIIGDNVTVGANACIIGDNLKIGDNVTIGAMAFINKDIPDNSTCYSIHKLYIKTAQNY